MIVYNAILGVIDRRHNSGLTNIYFSSVIKYVYNRYQNQIEMNEFTIATNYVIVTTVYN